MFVPSTSPAATSKALPAAWIDRLFQRLACLYGKHWLDMWVGMDLDCVKNTWAEALATYSSEELRCGMESCQTRPFPPTLPAFCLLCRPKENLPALLQRAIQEASLRRQHRAQNWPSARLFWAAQRMGSDLLQAAPDKLLPRFELAWQAAASDAHKPIPASPADRALPSPGQSSIPLEQWRQRIAELNARLTQPTSHRQWASDIATRPGQFSPVAIEAALRAHHSFGLICPPELSECARQLGLLAPQQTR